MHHALLFVSFAACFGLPDLVARGNSTSESSKALKSQGVVVRLQHWLRAL